MKKMVIAAAGKGTRMGELTKDRPKHLIHVHGKPFLYYLMRNIREAGFDDVTIVAGYFSEMIRTFVDEFYPGTRVLDQFAMLGEKKYGTACILECVSEAMEGEPFALVYGDNFYSPKDLRQFAADGGLNYVGGIQHAHPEHYGVLQMKGDWLQGIVEKPREFLGDVINTGLYRFEPEVFDYARNVQPSARGEYELTDVISAMAADGKVKVRRLEDYYLDFGKPADIAVMENFLQERGMV